jgi:hypothetical protein
MNKRTFIKNTIISLFAGSALAGRIQAKEPNIDYEAWFRRLRVVQRSSKLAALAFTTSLTGLDSRLEPDKSFEFYLDYCYRWLQAAGIPVFLIPLEGKTDIIFTESGRKQIGFCYVLEDKGNDFYLDQFCD